jgi:SAM-dependent methyltransferase
MQVAVLHGLFPSLPDNLSGEAYRGRSKLEVLLGKDLIRECAGKKIADFGCGHGSESVELARRGARRVVGVDIDEVALRQAREAAKEAGVDPVCDFSTSLDEPVDVIFAIDSFEHFDDPAAILALMARMLRPGGSVVASFGPTWFHPYGGHLFSAFPWSHLIFSEKALIRWRERFRSDGAQRFCEVEGGLNGMTIGRFERLVRESPFRFEMLECVPIRRLRLLQNRFTREFTTAIVRCKLVLRAG